MFEWKVDEFGAIWFRIPGSDSPHADWVMLEELTVTAKKHWMPTVDFTYAVWCSEKMDYVGGLTEEDPREYDEAEREEMRKLLRHLGYQRKEVWTWTRP